MRLKVISLNIWVGGELFDEMLAFLKAEQPDILLLQEVYDGHDPTLERRYRTLDVLQSELGFSQRDFAAMYLEKLPFGKLERGNAVLTNLPITNRMIHWLYDQYREYEDAFENWAISPRNLEEVQLDVAGKSLHVFNFQGVWDLDGERDTEAKLRMSQVILKAVKGKQPVILAGDTNVQPNTQTIRAIERQLQSVFKGELTTTFNIRRKDLVKFPGYATAAVDMAFVSSDLQVTEHTCPDVDISDHLPLVFTLELT